MFQTRRKGEALSIVIVQRSDSDRSDSDGAGAALETVRMGGTHGMMTFLITADAISTTCTRVKKLIAAPSTE